jgi:hypothetical protein
VRPVPNQGPLPASWAEVGWSRRVLVRVDCIGGHRHAHVPELAERDEVPVVDEALDGLGDAHPLVHQLAGLVLLHAAPVLVRIVPAEQLAATFLEHVERHPLSPSRAHGRLQSRNEHPRAL